MNNLLEELKNKVTGKGVGIQVFIYPRFTSFVRQAAARLLVQHLRSPLVVRMNAIEHKMVKPGALEALRAIASSYAAARPTGTTA